MFSKTKLPKSLMIIFCFVVVGFLLFLGFQSEPPKVEAQLGGSHYTVSGWAWAASDLRATSQQTGVPGSDDLGHSGWISFNCDDFGSFTCLTSHYGLIVNGKNEFEGEAWSSNIGWIKFGEELSGFPTGFGTQAINSKIDLSTNKVIGWARAQRAIKSEGQTLGGWDGWISLAGTAADTNNSPYGVKYNPSIDPLIGTLTGFAWGGDVMGWIEFRDVEVNLKECVLDLDANPNTLPFAGGVSTLTWDGNNLDDDPGKGCSASWTTQTAISGTEDVTLTQTTTYSISCQCLDGSTAFNSVTVSVPPPPPVDLCPSIPGMQDDKLGPPPGMRLGLVNGVEQCLCIPPTVPESAGFGATSDYIPTKLNDCVFITDGCGPGEMIDVAGNCVPIECPSNMDEDPDAGICACPSNLLYTSDNYNAWEADPNDPKIKLICNCPNGDPPVNGNCPVPPDPQCSSQPTGAICALPTTDECDDCCEDYYDVIGYEYQEINGEGICRCRAGKRILDDPTIGLHCGIKIYIPPAQCEDGIDNDRDFLIDYPADPGCVSRSDDNEDDSAPQPGDLGLPTFEER